MLPLAGFRWQQAPRIAFNVALLGVATFGSCLGVELCCAVARETPDERPGVEWRPKTYICPLELRPLPPADEVLADYDVWTQEDAQARTSKHYVLRIDGSEQRGLRVKRRFREGGRPSASAPSTEASFEYVSPELGRYILSWQLYGWHWPHFLAFGRQPRHLIVAPLEQPLTNMPPRLLIFGIEGVEAHADSAQCTPLPRSPPDPGKTLAE